MNLQVARRQYNRFVQEVVLTEEMPKREAEWLGEPGAKGTNLDEIHQTALDLRLASRGSSVDAMQGARERQAASKQVADGGRGTADQWVQRQGVQSGEDFRDAGQDAHRKGCEQADGMETLTHSRKQQGVNDLLLRAAAVSVLFCPNDTYVHAPSVCSAYLHTLCTASYVCVSVLSFATRWPICTRSDIRANILIRCDAHTCARAHTHTQGESVATIEKLALALEDAIWLKLGPIRPIGGYGRQRRKAEEVEGNGQVEKANDTGHCPQDLPT